MRAEVIAIGDELTSGQRLDTNTQWLSQKLGDLGIRVLFHTTVGDDLTANISAFRLALERADLVVCTGGLGPTADDLTRQALAEATGVTLEQNDDALEHIRNLFARRKREMPASNTVQAFFPAGSRVVPNPQGTAPGIDLSYERSDGSLSRCFALPGVPAEMREMWSQTVEPAVLEMLGKDRTIIRHHCIRCFGAGESQIESMLPDLIRRGRVPSVGITASQATITLRITARAATVQECEQLIEPTAETIRGCLGSLVYGEQDQTLQDVVIAMLAARQQTLATTECDAGGMLARWLSVADRSGTAFVGGLVIRQPSKLALLETNRVNDGDWYCAETIEQMAVQIRDRFSTDWGLALGPYPPTTDVAEIPDVQFALAGRDGVLVRSFPFAAHSEILEQLTVKRALDVLRLQLMT